MSGAVVPVLRWATPADADAITAVHLASRAAAMPWSPVVPTPAETRWWVEHVVLTQYRTWVATGDDVLGSVSVDDGRDDEEREPDVTYAWRR